MCSFNDLKRKGFHLYRGSCGPIGKSIMQVAVGPVYEVAKSLVNNTNAINNSLHDQVYRFFEECLAHGKPFYNPYTDLPDRLDFLLRAPIIRRNHITIFEHVVNEEEVLSVNTARRLESTTKNPQVAILYAYGIITDEYFLNHQTNFAGGQPNKNAFVVCLDRTSDEELANAYEFNYAGVKFGIDECRRRIDRDQEVLLGQAEEPTNIVDLPDFDISNVDASLNSAANTLITGGTAII